VQTVQQQSSPARRSWINQIFKKIDAFAILLKDLLLKIVPSLKTDLGLAEQMKINLQCYFDTLFKKNNENSLAVATALTKGMSKREVSDLS
jgi:hypothetical protein